MGVEKEPKFFRLKMASFSILAYHRFEPGTVFHPPLVWTLAPGISAGILGKTGLHSISANTHPERFTVGF